MLPRTLQKYTPFCFLDLVIHASLLFLPAVLALSYYIWNAPSTLLPPGLCAWWVFVALFFSKGQSFLPYSHLSIILSGIHWPACPPLCPPFLSHPVCSITTHYCSTYLFGSFLWRAAILSCLFVFVFFNSENYRFISFATIPHSSLPVIQV